MQIAVHAEHHGTTDHGVGITSHRYFTAATIIIAIPTGIKIFSYHWLPVHDCVKFKVACHCWAGASLLG